MNTNIDGFQKMLRLCALEGSSLSIGRVTESKRKLGFSLGYVDFFFNSSFNVYYHIAL